MSHHFSEEIILNFVGATYFVRGKQYYRSRMVTYAKLSEDVLTGKVKGSAGSIYDVSIFLESHDICDSECSCPIGFDCKHVAALYLEALHRFGPKIAATEKHMGFVKPAVSAEPVSLWKNSLRGFVNQPSISIQKKLEIAFRLEQVRAYGSEKLVSRLQLRPRLFDPVTGKSSIGDIKWADARYSYSHDIPQFQKVFFRRLAMSLLDYYDRSGGWVTVMPDKAAYFWPVLLDYKKAGVALVSGSKENFFVGIQERLLRPGFDIREGQDGIVLSPKFLVGDEEFSPEQCVLVGVPPIFAVVLSENPTGKNIQHIPFSLCPFPDSATFSSQSFPEAVKIPQKDVENFQREFLPALVLHYPLKNYSEKVDVPEVVTPLLSVSVEKASAMALRFDCAFLYGKEKVRSSNSVSVISVDGKNVVRLPEHEKKLVEKIVSHFLRFQLPQTQKFDGSSAFYLEKLQAVRFLREVLPMLQADPDFVVEVAEDLPNFVLDMAVPSIEFSVEEDQEGQMDWFDLHITIALEEEKIPFSLIFAALTAGEEYLFLESGRYFSLKHQALDQLRTLIEEAKAVRDKNKTGLSISRFQAGLWADLQKLGIIQKQTEQWMKSMHGLLDLKNIVPVKIPKKLKAELRHYQQDGFFWLKFLREHNLGGILADDMGLGKTLQAIALFCSVREDEIALGKKISNKSTVQKKPFLVIAPTSVVENWECELKKFAPHLKVVVFRSGDRSKHYKAIRTADVLLISYALVNRDIDLLRPLRFDTLLLDEAQFVKNHQAKVYGAIRKLQASAKIALTGTPMENNVMELWSIFSIVSPGLFPAPDHFQKFYRRPIEKLGDKEALERLRRRIRPFMLRRKKELVARELPPKIEQVLLLELNEKHRHVYDTHLQHERQRVLGMLKEGGLKDHRFEILAALTKMRQLCLHPVLVDQKHANVPATKLTALSEQLQMLVAEGHKALVFSQFTGFLSEVKKTLDHDKIPYLYLDGATKNRKVLLEDFQKKSGPPVFLISLKAGGFGLNLTSADYCILLDPWWNPAVESQAIDRTHRIGQMKSVMVYKMIAKDTIEEKVLKLQEKKRNLFKNVLEDGDVFASLVTESDIRGIFE